LWTLLLQASFLFTGSGVTDSDYIAFFLRKSEAKGITFIKRTRLTASVYLSGAKYRRCFFLKISLIKDKKEEPKAKGFLETISLSR
jgi:hypothetical protein